jgi:hypothetical protein
MFVRVSIYNSKLQQTYIGNNNFVEFALQNTRTDIYSDWRKITSPEALAKISIGGNLGDLPGFLYSNKTYEFRCTGSYFVFLPGYLFCFKFKNGSEWSSFGTRKEFYYSRRGE